MDNDQMDDTDDPLEDMVISCSIVSTAYFVLSILSL